jgi:hypothetical protein
MLERSCLKTVCGGLGRSTGREEAGLPWRGVGRLENRGVCPKEEKEAGNCWKLEEVEGKDLPSSDLFFEIGERCKIYSLI